MLHKSKVIQKRGLDISGPLKEKRGEKSSININNLNFDIRIFKKELGKFNMNKEKGKVFKVSR